MGETVNGPPYFEIDVSIFWHGRGYCIVVGHPRGNILFHSHILIPVHWREKVKVFDVYEHILCSGHAENTVPQDFGRRQIGGTSSDITWVRDEVSTSGEADTVWVLLFWAVIDYQYSICDDSIGWDFSYFLMGEYE